MEIFQIPVMLEEKRTQKNNIKQHQKDGNRVVLLLLDRLSGAAAVGARCWASSFGHIRLLSFFLCFQQGCEKWA